MCSFTYDRILQWSECDPAGIIFFPRYAEWMVDGLNMMLLSLGFDPSGRLPDGALRGLPSIGYQSRFMAAPQLYDVVTHRLHVSGVGRSSIEVAHHFEDAGGRRLAEADEKRVFLETRGDQVQSVPVPDALREKLADPTLVVPVPAAAAGPRHATATQGS